MSALAPAAGQNTFQEKTILYAEDNPVVSLVTQKIFRKHGFTLIVAEDGKQAMELYENHRDSINLFFLDIMMPHKSGLEIATEILNRDPSAKILLSSGFYDEENSPDEVMSRVHGFLQKPYNQSQLIDAIQRMIQK